MPYLNLILNLPGFSIVKVTGYQPLLLDVKYNRLPRCSHYYSKKVRKKASYIRQVHHELIGHRRSILRFKAYKLYCHTCNRYGNQQFPGIHKHHALHGELRQPYSMIMAEESLKRTWQNVITKAKQP